MKARTTPIRICIVGAGGLGTVLAGFLSRAGAAVTLLVRPAHAAAYGGPRVVVSGEGAFEAPVTVAAGRRRTGNRHPRVAEAGHLSARRASLRPDRHRHGRQPARSRPGADTAAALA